MVKRNSIILSLYVFLASVYYLFSGSIRILIFGVSLFLILYMGIRVKKQTIVLKTNRKVIIIMTCIFFYTLFVQLINGILTPFTIYYLSSPILAYFIFKNKINTKYLSFPMYMFAMYILCYFFLHRTLNGVLNGNVSENYVSIILIMNIATIYIVKDRQNEPIPILPAFLGLLLSILAIGRSGIITTLFILLLVLWIKWRAQPFFMKIISLTLLLLPISIIITIKWDLVVSIFDNLEFFEKFSRGGVSSPSRDIIKRAYLSNINSVTFFTGYNYVDNYWFQHYGLNPHNSYIRLHYFSGFAFFIIIPVILMSLIKLIKKNIFFSGLFIAILLRSWTDSVLFLTLFDYVPVLFIMTAFLDKRKKIIKMNE